MLKRQHPEGVSVVTNWTCVVGMSKSGTTALFSSIARAMRASDLDPYLLHEKYRLEQYRSLHWYCPEQPLLAKLLLTRKGGVSYHLAENCRHRFHIVRDPRDRLVSQVLDFPRMNAGRRDPGQVHEYIKLIQAKERSPGDHNLLDLFAAGWKFAREKEFDHQMLGKQGNLNLQFARDVNTTMVRYEDMVAGDLDVVSDQLEMRVENGRPLESQRLVLRSGASGAWRSWFTPQDVEIIRPYYAPILESLGYPADDWQLEDRQFPPELGSQYAQQNYDTQRAELATVRVTQPPDPGERPALAAWLSATRKRANDGDAGAATRLAELLLEREEEQIHPGECERLALFAARSGNPNGMKIAGIIQSSGRLTDVIDWAREYNAST